MSPLLITLTVLAGLSGAALGPVAARLVRLTLPVQPEEDGETAEAPTPAAASAPVATPAAAVASAPVDLVADGTPDDTAGAVRESVRGADGDVAAEPAPVPVVRAWARTLRADRLAQLLGLALAFLWVLTVWRLAPEHPAAVPAYLLFVGGCLVLAVTDARTHLLPDRLTLPLFACTLLLLGAASLAAGEPDRIVRAASAAVLTAGVFWLLAAVGALLFRDALGLGDVKLVPTLALGLAWFSWQSLLWGLFAAFVLGGLVSMGALLSGRYGWKDSLPFGPWLALGAVAGVLGGDALVTAAARALLAY